jgi:hypothetical protein
MKKIINLVTLRAGIATALYLSFLLYPPLRLSSAKAAATTRPGADLKSESQLKSEAARYDGAIRAISGVATMKLETGEDLKKAFAILDRERGNLKLHFSKLVVLAISDSTFSSAVKKKLPDERAAEAFAKELKADLNGVLKLEGAGSLKTRMERSVEADAAVLRRAGERLKAAGERLKKTAHKGAAPGVWATGEFRVIRAGFSAATQPITAPSPVIFGPLIVIAISYAVGLFFPSVFVGISVIQNIFTEQGQDQVAACQERVDASLSRCVSEAEDLPSGFPFFIREGAVAACYGTWLIQSGECLLFA